jgi:isopenicillin N synthase-like dioxygenase
MSDLVSAHTAFQTLPVVNISGLYSPDLQERQRAAERLGQAAREAGFFYVTGHGMPRARVEALLACAKAFFALPLTEKMRHYIGTSTNHSGYVPEGEERFGDAKSVDRKEAYDIGFDAPAAAPRRPLIGPNQWPSMPRFKEDVSAYYAEAIALSQMLFRGFALALGLSEDALARRASQPPSQLRLIHYPYDASPQSNAQGIGAHTDYECFTILLPTAPGLEVVNGAGEWIDAPVLPDAFVVNIGDMMEVLSGGQFVATRHRVRKVGEERYSFPLFCALDYDEVIKPVVGSTGHHASLNCGDHIYAQTQQTFTYLKERLARGEAELPTGARAIDSFGRQELAE